MGFSFFGRSNKTNKNSDSDAEKIKQGCKELDKIFVDIEKETGVNLTKNIARVVVLIDHSGSASDEYEDGTIQEVLNKILPFAIKFDDDKKIEVFLFDDVCVKLDKDMNINNYEDYVEKEIIKKRYKYGGTQYAPAIRTVDKYYNDKESEKIPTIVFFITDGENFESDKKPSDEAFIESSDHGIFWMLIGVGTDNFDYLRHLDDLKGRKYDNTGFMKFKDFKNIVDVEMFTKALKDYTPWLKDKGYIK